MLNKWSWANMYLKKFELEEIWSWKNLSLSFAAKQPLVYLNLEFGDKYNDVVFALWELGTIFVFDPFLNKVSPRSSEFHWKHTMIAEIVCWDCVQLICIVMEDSIVEEDSICPALTPARQQPPDKPPPVPWP